MAEAGRKIHEELKNTTLKDWGEGKTTKFLHNKYKKKKRKKNEDEVEVAALVPPGETTETAV